MKQPHVATLLPPKGADSGFGQPGANDMHLHLDLLGGIAGDMFIATLLDAFPEHADGVLASIAAVPTVPRAECRLMPFRDAVLQGKRFEVSALDAPASAHDGHHHHHQDDGAHHHAAAHDHIRWSILRERIAAAPLDRRVAAHALGIFTLLAEAEAEVHGMSVDDVAFHEVGAWDSVADVVGAAHLVAALGGNGRGGSTTRWTVGSVPVGSGRVNTAHGPMPVPAPATALLLRGYTLLDDGIAGERVTPTGAAILRHVCGPTPGVDGDTSERRPPGRLVRTGTGFGSRRLPGISNCLRVLAFEPAAADSNGVNDDEDADAPHRRRLAVVEFEVDDQTPEALATGLDRLRARHGVVDVVQSAVHGKKGRIGAAIRLLVQPEALDEAVAACFHETTTIGLRHHIVESVALYRTTTRVTVDERPVRVKAVQRPTGVTAKAESDDLAVLAGHRLRADVAAAAVAATLAPAADEIPETPQ